MITPGSVHYSLINIDCCPKVILLLTLQILSDPDQIPLTYVSVPYTDYRSAFSPTDTGNIKNDNAQQPTAHSTYLFTDFLELLLGQCTFGLHLTWLIFLGDGGVLLQQYWLSADKCCWTWQPQQQVKRRESSSVGQLYVREFHRKMHKCTNAHHHFSPIEKSVHLYMFDTSQ